MRLIGRLHRLHRRAVRHGGQGGVLGGHEVPDGEPAHVRAGGADELPSQQAALLPRDDDTVRRSSDHTILLDFVTFVVLLQYIFLMRIT